MATLWLPPNKSPTGKPKLADCNAMRISCTVTPEPFIRCGSICTNTARRGPPMVTTSRVPGTRLMSASMLCATRSRSKALTSSFLPCNVRDTIGTSSMPLGLMSGSGKPRLRGNQSAFSRIVSCNLTKASVRGTPTLNCTVMMATPGRETEKTCSTPAILDNTCSAGMATICSTSRTDAPGNGAITLAMVTLICGSSSRGVTITANTPSKNATSASKGVICALWKAAAMRPEIPIFGSLMGSLSALCIDRRGVGHDLLA